MTNVDPLKAYSDFWERLLPAYKISKGSMRLPIATSLLEIEDFNIQKTFSSLSKLLQTILDEHGTKEQALKRAKEAGEERINPLITDEFSGVVRFDCVFNAEGEVKILELNCDYPDGLLLHDHTFSVLSNKNSNLHHQLLSEILDKDPHVHLLHDEKAIFLDAYHYEHTCLVENGTSSSVGAEIPTIDKSTIRRCLEVSKMSPDMCVSLAKLKDTRFINTFALRTLGYKDLLSKIEHEYIPQTIVLSENTETIVLEEKNKWIIKPANGCEGNDIYFGHDCDQATWEQIIASKNHGTYIAQEYVPIQKIEVTLFENETIVQKNLFFDLCPHFFIKQGQVIGSGHTLMRFSENPVVNVTHGGGIGYYATNRNS